MFKKINITIVFLFLIMLVNGCSWNKKMDKKEFTHRETILTKAKNYGGLITLYRNELKIEENDDIRLKLATAYYQSGDTKSSLYYLQPIVHKKMSLFIYCKLKILLIEMIISQLELLLIIY